MPCANCPNESTSWWSGPASQVWRLPSPCVEPAARSPCSRPRTASAVGWELTSSMSSSSIVDSKCCSPPTPRCSVSSICRRCGCDCSTPGRWSGWVGECTRSGTRPVGRACCCRAHLHLWGACSTRFVSPVCCTDSAEPIPSPCCAATTSALSLPCATSASARVSSIASSVPCWAGSSSTRS